MITRNELIKNREYVLSHTKELCLGSTPRPLFREGLFYEDNWNGGDDVIRQFISYIQNQDKSYHVFSKNEHPLIMRYIFFDDYNRIYFTYVNEYGDSTKWSFGWHINRGRIDLAMCDDEDMTEFDYVELLNKIEETAGFKFDFYL